MRLWKSLSEDIEEMQSLTQKHKNYTSVKFDGVLLNPKPEIIEQLLVEDLDLAEEDIVVIELPKGKDTWTFVPKNIES